MFKKIIFETWVEEVNKKTSEELINCYNESGIGSWNENYITTRLLKSIQSIGLELDWEDKPQKVKWECFKLKSKAEEKFGDVALIVKIFITENHYIEGVAYYEAKRQFFHENMEPKGFISLDRDQLSRININTHASNVVLYDSNKEIGIATAVLTVFVNELKIIKSILISGRKLHNYGDSWVRAIGENFLGKNLDFQKESVDELKELIGKENGPSAIINAAITLVNNFEPKLGDYLSNNNKYKRLIDTNELKPKNKSSFDSDDLSPEDPEAGDPYNNNPKNKM